jgi:serine/threonine protein kinase
MTAIAPQDRYRRLDLLGRGGMGEVFLADDLLLRRKVAIKVVHRSTLSNPRAEKLLRREAKAAAALDNPFICKVYEVGEDAGGVFIAMEYIQGETLRQRMLRGPIPIKDTVSLAREIADGLDEAARQRVIHRDLKPSNIIITPQGHLKIMDFGLAKRLPGDDSVAESSIGTPDGMVVGTREYMSPEQLRGKPLEPSSDLFAFGLILFEMIAGHHPFRKSTAIDTQFAILNEEPPDLADTCPGAPGDLCDLVAALLSKAAASRPRIGEVRERLADVADSAHPDRKERTLATSASVEAFVAQKPRVVMAVGLALVLVVVALALWVGLRPEPAMPQARMATLVTWPSNEEQAALSPDSKSLTFISNRDGVKDIWLLELGGGEPRRITNAPGGLTAQTFSEDGSEVAYTLESETEKLLQTIRLDGGPPTRSLSLPNDTRSKRLIRWVGSDVFLETHNLDLLKVSLVTGTVTQVETPPKATARPFNFDVSRDGNGLTFGARNPDGSTSIWVQGAGAGRAVTEPGFQDGSPFFSDAAGQKRLFFESNRSGQEDLWLIERPGQKPRQITFGSNREFIESVSAEASTMIFSEVLEGGAIFSFDLQTGRRSQLTAENTRDITPSISARGQLAFARVSTASSLPWNMSSVLIGPVQDGRLRDARMVLREGWNPVLSPDGEWLAYMQMQGSTLTPRLHLLNVESGHSREIAEMPAIARIFMAFPWYFVQRDLHWSASGDLWFVAGSSKEGSRVLRLNPRSGGPPETVTRLQPDEIASSFVSNADGTRLFYVRSDRKPGGSIREVVNGHDSVRYSSDSGTLSILGIAGPALIVAHVPRPGEDRASVLSLEGTKARKLFDLEARASTLRLVSGHGAVAFSRRDARDVENLYLKNLETLAETMVSVNGIQGVSFSPVAVMGPHTLVFSQQLKNRDLGIIRIEQP